MNRRFNPPTVMKPAGAYSHGIEIPPNARWVYVAGQGGEDVNQKLVSNTLAGQAEQALKNILRVLEAADMGPGDIVRLNTFVVATQVDIEVLKALGAARSKVLGDIRPTGVMTAVSALAFPGMLVEIDAVAAKGAAGQA